MFKFIRKFYYKCIVENKAIGFPYQTLFQILEKYDKFNALLTKPYVTKGDYLELVNEDEVAAFKYGNTYDLFCENVHIQIVDDKDKILRVALKQPDDKWLVHLNGGPVGNKTMEAYLWYDVEVLGDRRFQNTIYTHGPWDEYVYKALDRINEKVKDYTIQANFAHTYNDLLFSKKKKAKKEDGFFNGVTINGQPVRVEGGVVIGSADSDPDMIGA